MFDLEYYNNIVHEKEFSDYIQSFGYIPMKGSPHDLSIKEWKNLNHNMDMDMLRKIVLWKPIRDIHIDEYLYILLKFEKDKIRIIENLNNLQYLKKIKDAVYNNDYYQHNKYAVIQTFNQTVGPISYSYMDTKQDLHKLLLYAEGNGAECSICLEAKNNRLSCPRCHTITCVKCRKRMKNRCPVCDRIQ